MQTIEKLKADQVKAIAKLETELSIAEECPIPPNSVMQVGTGEKAWINYKVKGIKGALAVFAAFDNVEPFSTAKDGCLHIKPESIMKESLREKADGFYALNLNMSEGDEFGPSAKLTFWTMLPVGVVRINCDIEGPGYIGTYSGLGMRKEAIKDRRGRITSYRYTPNLNAHSMADKTIRFIGGGDAPRFEYLFCSDTYENASPADMQHAVSQLETLVEQLRE